MDEKNKEFKIITSTLSKEKNEIEKRPFTKDTKEWSPGLETVLPIDGSEIPNFKAWVNWNSFHLDRNTGKGHDGFDFAAYVTTDNRVVFGLPEDTKIRAVADGVVKQVLDTPNILGGPYHAMINIEHGANESGMLSQYIHVRPKIKTGDSVKRGDVIAELYKGPEGDEGPLVHLHLSLVNGGARETLAMGRKSYLRMVNPGLIDPSIYGLNANPQGSANFKIPNLPDAQIEIAHFKRVRVGQ